MEYPFIPYHHVAPSREQLIEKSRSFYERLNRRRTVRDISRQAVPKEVVEHIVLAAGTAPSGAHKQPWTFCVVGSEEIKRKIRIAAEEEEYENYHGRMPKEWLEDLKPLGTDWHKPFLENAPWLIVLFRKVYDVADGKKKKNYYVQESVGIAAGMLITAIHEAGLVCLTHTPSPMNFLSEVLERPENEKPFLLIPVGYPEVDAKVPDLVRKPLEDIAVFY